MAEVLNIGSAAMPVSAGLQTAGLYLQGEILDMLGQGLASNLGTLLYVLAAVSGIFIIAIAGNYKFGLWFFLGPALFTFMTQQRVSTGGVAWQVGNKLYDTKSVSVVTEGLIPSKKIGQEEVAKVSLFFAKYDGMVSGIIQSLISVLKLGQLDTDINPFRMTEKYKGLFQLDVDDPQLKTFVDLLLGADQAGSSTGPDKERFNNQCIQYFAAKRSQYDPARIKGDETAEAQRIKVTEDLGNRKVISVQSGLYAQIGQMFQPDRNTGKVYLDITDNENPLQSDLQKLQPGLNNDGYSCKDLWTMTVSAVRKEVPALVERLAAAGLPPGMTSQDVLKKLSEKFGSASTTADREKGVLMLMDGVTMSMLMKRMAQLMPNFRKELEKSYHTLPNWLEEEGGQISSDTINELAKYLNISDEFEVKGEFFRVMLALPYIQGVALYFLAMSFPFVCFMLILPGRHNAFFLWMGLWLWVKMWDFGMAVVGVLGKVLDQLLPSVNAFNPQDIKEIGPAFAAIFAGDPSYSVRMHWNILAVCIGAVPVLTGLLVKKGGGDVMAAINQGVSSLGGRFGQAAAYYARAMKSTELAKSAELDRINTVADKLWTSLRSPELLNALASRAITGKATREGVAKSIKKALNSSGGGANFAKDVSSSLSKIYSGTNEAANVQVAQIIEKIVSRDLKQINYQTALKPENMEKGQLAVLMRYSHHAFFKNTSMPIEEHLLVPAQANTFRYGGVGDSAQNDLWRGIAKGTLGKGVPPY